MNAAIMVGYMNTIFGYETRNTRCEIGDFLGGGGETVGGNPELASDIKSPFRKIWE